MAIRPSFEPPEIIPLHVEDVSIERRNVERKVRVHVSTASHDRVIDETIAHDAVEIERVAIGRPVDAAPPDRQEGDVTVISVVEEVLFIERRLVLKEEIRLKRVRTTTQHRETVTLREQQAVIERAEPGARLSVLPSDLAPVPTPQTPRT